MAQRIPWSQVRPAQPSAHPRRLMRSGPAIVAVDGDAVGERKAHIDANTHAHRVSSEAFRWRYKRRRSRSQAQPNPGLPTRRACDDRTTTWRAGYRSMMWAGRLDRGTPAADPRRDERVCGCDTKKPRNKITHRLIGRRARRQPPHAAAPRPQPPDQSPRAHARSRRSGRPIRSATDRSRHPLTPNSARPPPAPLDQTAAGAI